jgi:hypothetical protein
MICNGCRLDIWHIGGERCAFHTFWRTCRFYDPMSDVLGSLIRDPRLVKPPRPMNHHCQANRRCRGLVCNGIRSTRPWEHCEMLSSLDQTVGISEYLAILHNATHHPQVWATNPLCTGHRLQQNLPNRSKQLESERVWKSQKASDTVIHADVAVVASAVEHPSPTSAKSTILESMSVNF